MPFSGEQDSHSGGENHTQNTPRDPSSDHRRHSSSSSPITLKVHLLPPYNVARFVF